MRGLWRWVRERRAVIAAIEEIVEIEGTSYRAARLARDALGRVR